MSYTISTLKTDLTSKLHGTSLAKVQGVDNLIDEAGRELLLDIDPNETKRIAQITGSVFDDVEDYSAPTDLKGNKFIDLRPQVNRTARDNFTQRYVEDFGLKRLIDDNMINVKYNAGTKSLRIKKNLPQGTLISDMNSLTDNGTWATSGTGSNLTQDTQNYITGSASLNFDITTGTGILTNSTLAEVNLEEHEDISTLFLWVYIPDTDNFTSVNVRWGSDASNYWEGASVQTTTQDGNSPLAGWNLFKFDWNGATSSGSPDSSAVDYVRISIIAAGDDTDFRVDKLISNLGTIFELEYYSKFIIRSSAGAFQENVDADTNIVNLDTDSYNLLLTKVAIKASQNMQGEDALQDLDNFTREYRRGIRQYQTQYPTEIIKPQQAYYRMPDAKFRNRRGGIGTAANEGR